MQENNTTETGLALEAPGTLTTVIGANAANISDIIMDNIKKIQDDPKFIPQAEAINSQVKSLIDVGKAEIEMLKVGAFLSQK